MVSPQVRDLLEAGVHFGHQTRRWNPKMKPFIFAARNGIYIIDLQKTVNALTVAKQKIAETIQRGKPVLFVGTKKQAKEVIKEEALRCGGFYVTERWLGGMLTNFNTIKQSIKKLKDIERMRIDGTLEKFRKKERSMIEHEAEKLQKYLGGIKDLNQLPGLVVVVDARKEKIAVAEASKLGIPIIGVVDTNADPDLIDFPIAGNDDAIKSIRILIHSLVDSAVDAKNSAVSEMLQAADEKDSGESDTEQAKETTEASAPAKDNQGEQQ